LIIATSRANAMPAASRTVRIDSHAHVFRRDHPVTAGARHAPQHDALLPELLALYDRHGVTHAVLTAPSFYGTDNSILLAALAAAPERLRGTVIVDPTFTRARLEELDSAGVVGIRLNMLRVSNLPDLRSAEWRKVLEIAAALDWHLEIYIEGPRLPVLLAPALEIGVKVVVDHFGSPDPALGLQCTGFRQLLDAMGKGRTWTKLSAPYRLGGADPVPYAAALLAAGGAERLVWASDWPWTQNAEGLTYAKVLGWLDRWIPDPAQRARILGDTAWSVFGFE
jgi:predicted TIM-barrel fold metal-dependent hydrolase